MFVYEIVLSDGSTVDRDDIIDIWLNHEYCAVHHYILGSGGGRGPLIYIQTVYVDSNFSFQVQYVGESKNGHTS